MRSFRLANYKQGYSEAFAEQRNIWLRAHIVWIAAAVLALYLVIRLIRLIRRRTADRTGAPCRTEIPTLLIER